jgi:cytochrome c-type biogenesis protein CcmE
VVPDLFREGQGVIAHGRLKENGVFVAKTILAKHDENYMPPEVMESLATHVAEKVSSNSDQ